MRLACLAFSGMVLVIFSSCSIFGAGGIMLCFLKPGASRRASARVFARTAEKAPGPPMAAGQGPRRGPQSLARRFEDAGKGVGADAEGCVSVTGRGGGTGEVCRFWQWSGKNGRRASPSGNSGAPPAVSGQSVSWEGGCWGLWLPLEWKRVEDAFLWISHFDC